MALEIYKNQTGNDVSPDYQFRGGTLRVGISGVLDGADMTAYRRVSPDNVGSVIAWCSWRTSAQDTLVNASLGLQPDLGVSTIFFEVTNAGASTDISVDANVEG